MHSETLTEGPHRSSFEWSPCQSSLTRPRPPPIYIKSIPILRYHYNTRVVPYVDAQNCNWVYIEPAGYIARGADTNAYVTLCCVHACMSRLWIHTPCIWEHIYTNLHTSYVHTCTYIYIFACLDSKATCTTTSINIYIYIYIYIYISLNSRS